MSKKKSERQLIEEEMEDLEGIEEEIEEEYEIPVQEDNKDFQELLDLTYGFYSRYKLEDNFRWSKLKNEN